MMIMMKEESRDKTIDIQSLTDGICLRIISGQWCCYNDFLLAIMSGWRQDLWRVISQLDRGRL